MKQTAVLISLVLAFSFIAGCLGDEEPPTLPSTGQGHNERISGGEIWDIVFTEPPESGFITYDVGQSSKHFEFYISGANLSYPAIYSINLQWEVSYGVSKVGDTRLYEVYVSREVIEFETQTIGSVSREFGGVINRNDELDDAFLTLSIDYTPGTTNAHIKHGAPSSSVSIVNNWNRTYSRSSDLFWDVYNETVLVEFDTNPLYNGTVDIFFEDNGTHYDTIGIFEGSGTGTLPDKTSYLIMYLLEYQGEQFYGNKTIFVDGNTHYSIYPDGEGEIVQPDTIIEDFSLWIIIGIVGTIVVIGLVLVFRRKKPQESF